MALQTLAEQYVDGADVTITDVEAAISAYAAEHPTSIKIASKSSYQEVYLEGEWPDTITLNAQTGDGTIIIIVNENGQQTTINADGSVSVSSSQGSGSNSGSSSNSGTSGTSGTGGNSGSVTPSVSAPSFAGNTQFEESTQVTITGPSGSEIHYTVDGSTPTAESPVYSEPLTFTETTTLKAIAIKDGQSSSVTTRTYTKGTNGDDDDSGDTN